MGNNELIIEINDSLHLHRMKFKLKLINSVIAFFVIIFLKFHSNYEDIGNEFEYDLKWRKWEMDWQLFEWSSWTIDIEWK